MTPDDAPGDGAPSDRNVPRGPDGEPLPVPDEDAGGLPGDKDSGGPGDKDSGGPGGFCVGTHTLCDDFSGATAGAKWTKTAEAGGGAVSLSSTLVKSAPNSMRTTLPSGCNQAGAQVVLTKAGAPSSVKIAFDVNVVKISNSASVHLAGVEYTLQSGSYRNDFAIRGGKVEFQKNHIVGGTFALVQTSAQTFPTGKFVHVEIELTYATNIRGVVRVDGTTVIDNTTPLVASFAGSQTNFDFGAYADNNCDAASELHFDDVVYDLALR